MMRHVLAAAVMMAQPFAGGGSNSGTVPVSPSVMAMDLASVDASGRGTLQLMILWRGTPGWFMRGDGGSSSSGGGSIGTGAAMLYSFSLSQGGVELNARFDPSAGKLWIQDKEELTLGDANVVLVDAVDSAAGPHVVRMLRIDPEFETMMEPPPYALPGRGPQMRPRPMPVQTFIRRSPELIEFLQCDTPLPGLKPYEQQVFGAMCAFVTQP